MWSFLLILKNKILDPACQQNIPDLDGGEGCSEYIIHGTNVDLSASIDNNTTEQPGTDESPSGPARTESPVDRENECMDNKQ